jgi:cobalt-zinc-cadmium resistance protein CzcA
VVVTERNGVPVVISDVATVEIGFQQRQGMVALNDNDSIVNGTILMRKGETPALVLEGVKAKIEELNQSILPKDVQLVPYYDRAWLIGNTLPKPSSRTSPKAPLSSASSCSCSSAALPPPVSSPSSSPCRYWPPSSASPSKNIPANLLSLGAMDFGIIVDGAVIVVENIFRAASHDRTNTPRSKNSSPNPPHGRPPMFSMLIIILAHLPIFALQRHEGRIFAPMAYTITSALIGSPPVLPHSRSRPLCLSHAPHPGRKRLLLRAAHSAYRRLLAGALARPPHRPDRRRLLPPRQPRPPPPPWLGVPSRTQRGQHLDQLHPPPASHPPKSIARSTAPRTSLLQIPEVARVVSQGRPRRRRHRSQNIQHVRGPRRHETRIRMARLSDQETLLARMEKTLDELPGITPTFSQPIRDSVLESISQIDGQIVIKMFGDDSEVLKREMDELLKLIKPIRGVGRAFVDRRPRVPQLRIEVDRDRAAKYGLNIADIEDVIETALGGHAATQIWEGENASTSLSASATRTATTSTPYAT